MAHSTIAAHASALSTTDTQIAGGSDGISEADVAPPPVVLVAFIQRRAH